MPGENKDITQKLSETTAKPAAKQPPESDVLEDPDDWKPGTVLIREYEVKKILGKGGMGAVYLMVLRNYENVKFAVKTLKINQLSDPSRKQSFLRELRTWIELPDYPYLVACRFFRTIDDRLAIFSEYVEGGSLRDWIRQKKMDTAARILDVAIQSAWGLQAAHDEGVIHQDVKPENILMTPDGMAKISDFGLSRACLAGGVKSQSNPGPHSILVSTGGMTIAYCSPEQANHEKLSRKTDIWSLGLSILEMFTGSVTWKFGFSADQVLDAICKGQSAELRLPIPDIIIKVLKKCFELSPENRWATMNELADELIRIYEDLTGMCYFRKRPRIPAAISKSDSVRSPYILPQLKWDNPMTWYERALKLTGNRPLFSDKTIQEAKGSQQSRDFISLEIYEEAEKLFGELKSQPGMDVDDDLAELYQNKSLLLRHMNDLPGAISSLHKAINILSSRLTGNTTSDRAVALAKIYIHLGVCYYKTGDYPKGVEFQDKALELISGLPNTYFPDQIQLIDIKASLNKGMMLRLMGKVQESRKIESRKIATLRNLIEQKGRYEYSDCLATLLLNNGNTLVMLREYSAALANFEECRRIREQLVYQDGLMEYGSDLATVYMNIANSYRHLPDYSQAIDMYQKAEQLEIKLIENSQNPEMSPFLIRIYGNQAAMYAEMGDYGKASELYNKTISNLNRIVFTGGRTDLIETLLKTYINHGLYLNFIKELPNAERQYDEALSVLKRFKETGDPRQTEIYRSQIYLNKAMVLNNMGRPDEAAELIMESESSIEHLVYDNNRMELIIPLALIYHIHAEIQHALEHHEYAFMLIDKAIDVRERLFFEKQLKSLLRELVNSYLLKTKILNSMNQSEEARKLIQQSIQMIEKEISENKSDDLADLLISIKAEFPKYFDHQ